MSSLTMASIQKSPTPTKAKVENVVLGLPTELLPCLAMFL